MLTYVLCTLPNGWNIHRVGKDVTLVDRNIQDEEEAIGIAIQKARAEPPSQVLQISVSGNGQIIAGFDGGIGE